MKIKLFITMMLVSVSANAQAYQQGYVPFPYPSDINQPYQYNAFGLTQQQAFGIKQAMDEQETQRIEEKNDLELQKIMQNNDQEWDKIMQKIRK